MPTAPTPFPLLSTDRLDLIEIKDTHAADLLRLFTNPEVTAFYNVVPLHTTADTLRIIGMFRERQREEAAIRWGIALKGQQEMIGTIGFNSYTKGRKGVIVYALEPAYWGKGFITEALTAVLAYGFHTLAVNRIEAEVMPGNVASEKVLEKSGFLHEGLLRQWLYWEGKWYNINMYALLQADFSTRHTA
ncbi:GNAT family N-acetyltransferase [Chitinophaga nivalis]|uniref:GNAT family N-acetyltransferase n=1 Tax=Chitinophaga nivalis TaxID=2991709 RepID=A0ABT3IGP9_9BACT|nr:GNAT family protein [Chitinophaga nivalis]MCW3467192.1 GNAT family N-acetyltransferase [Chitinophaga nivalis]MCW3483116.1 GNAT family N-acetyltransferase [Chitinophaga nivalis]